MSQPTKKPPSLPLIPEQASLVIGDRIITPTGREGVIILPKFDTPLHHLIEFENGAVLWMLRGILSAAPVTPTKKRRKPA